MLKTGSIHLAVLMQYRLVTDRQTPRNSIFYAIDVRCIGVAR